MTRTNVRLAAFLSTAVALAWAAALAAPVVGLLPGDAPAAAPPTHATDGARQDVTTCDLGPTGPACWLACRPLDHVAVEATAGSGVSFRCGSAAAACAGPCSARSAIPVVSEDFGVCQLDFGTSGRCFVGSGA